MCPSGWLIARFGGCGKKKGEIQKLDGCGDEVVQGVSSSTASGGRPDADDKARTEPLDSPDAIACAT